MNTSAAGVMRTRQVVRNELREGEDIQGKEWGFHLKFHLEMLEDLK